MARDSARFSTYWRGPGGLADVLRISFPLIVSTLSWTLMHFIDRVFLINYSADAVAAALPAGVMSFAIVCFPLGVAMYVNTFVAQYHGAERRERIGQVVWQGIWLAALVAPFVLLTAPLVHQMFVAADHAPAIVELESEYYYILCYGAGTLVGAAALSSFFSGRGGVKVVMIVDSAAALLNVVLDYAWIFGHWGFPEGGIAGAAWATVVAQWFKTLVYFAIFLLPEFRREFGTWSGRRLDLSLMGRLLKFGAPNGVQFMFEVGGFAAFLLVVGKLGNHELAATSLAFNLNTLAFMPVFGIGIATSTLVGQWLGRNKPALATRSVWSAFTIGAVYISAIGALYVLAPNFLMAAYSVGDNDADFIALRDLTTVLLRFVAFYCLFDAMNVIFAAAIKGAGDTRFVLYTTLATAPLPVIAAQVGVSWYGLGLLWCWIAISGWVTLLGVLYLLRFLGGKWRSMRVIEEQASAVEEVDRNSHETDAASTSPEPPPVLTGESTH